MLKPVEKPIKFIKNLSTKGKSYPITHVSAVIDDNGESVKSTIDSLKNKKVTWLELKNKRDAGKLIPGSLYRITDYQCTTSQNNTRSAGHQFDIVLLALSEDKLAEEGWAMMNESNIYDVTFSDGVTKKCWIYQDDYYDNIVECTTLLGDSALSIGEENDNDVILNKTNRTAICTAATSLQQPDLTYNYFQNSNLSAWKVWYCLDNDKSRFAWADNTNGKGVIYRLIDEWNIDYPCDFKNMQTLVPMDSNGDIAMQNPVTSKYCYVFTDNTSGEPEDLSIKGHAVNIKVKPNLIGETHSAMYFSPGTLFYTNINDEQIYLFSNITVGIATFTIFINRGHSINILDVSNSVILKDCRSVCIGYYSDNIMLDTVVSSTFGSDCRNIQLANAEGLNYGNNGVELATKNDLN